MLCRLLLPGRRMKRTMKHICLGHYDKGKLNAMTETERSAILVIPSRFLLRDELVRTAESRSKRRTQRPREFRRDSSPLVAGAAQFTLPAIVCAGARLARRAHNLQIRRRISGERLRFKVCRYTRSGSFEGLNHTNSHRSRQPSQVIRSFGTRQASSPGPA